MTQISDTASPTTSSTMSSTVQTPLTPRKKTFEMSANDDPAIATNIGQMPSSVLDAQQPSIKDASPPVVTTTTTTTVSITPSASPTKLGPTMHRSLREVKSTMNLRQRPSSKPDAREASVEEASVTVVTTTTTTMSSPSKRNMATPKKSAARSATPRTSPNKTPILFKPQPTIPIPHPSELQPPAPGTKIMGYYAITVGQEVGIFFTWSDVNARVSCVSGNEQAKFKSWDDALAVYSAAYKKGTVEAKPFAGGPFDPFKVVETDSEEGEAAYDVFDDDLVRLVDELSL